MTEIPPLSNMLVLFLQQYLYQKYCTSTKVQMMVLWYANILNHYHVYILFRYFKLKIATEIQYVHTNSSL